MSLNITTCLWFDRQGEEAAKFYVDLIPNSKINKVSHYPDHGGVGGDRAGEVLMVEFELDGRPFTALNGGPQFTFSEAVSLQLFVHDQAELDRLWDGLLADGGQESQCGWLKDRYGFSWQTVPVKMGEWMTGPNADAVFKTMMPMRKLDMAALEAASNGSAPVN